MTTSLALMAAPGGARLLADRIQSALALPICMGGLSAVRSNVALM